MVTSAEREDDEPLPGAGTREGTKLREAVRAFEAGDFRKVRDRCRDLADAEDAEVRAAAEALRSRIDVDPVQVVVVLACFAVVAAIAYVWIL
ncbi:MAG: hypothetical protein VYE22_19185 [Myxococcota bacterium]|nr:hypothetical protein [Myxococcota bacterium]